MWINCVKLFICYMNKCLKIGSLGKKLSFPEYKGGGVQMEYHFQCQIQNSVHTSNYLSLWLSISWRLGGFEYRHPEHLITAKRRMFFWMDPVPAYCSFWRFKILKRWNIEGKNICFHQTNFVLILNFLVVKNRTIKS